MYRGTTPTININVIGCDLSNIKTINLVMKNNKYIIERYIESEDFQDNAITFALTQEETLLLDARYKLYIQLRLLSNDDKVVASGVKTLIVKDILKGEVLV